MRRMVLELVNGKDWKNNSEQVNPDEHWPVDTFLSSWNWWPTIWYHWFVFSTEKNKIWLPPFVGWVLHQISFSAIDPDCNWCTVYGDVSVAGTWQVLLWARFIDYIFRYLYTNNMQVSKHWTLSPSNSRCWWLICDSMQFNVIFTIASLLHHTGIIPFKICRARQFLSKYDRISRHFHPKISSSHIDQNLIFLINLIVHFIQITYHQHLWTNMKHRLSHFEPTDLCWKSSTSPASPVFLTPRKAIRCRDRGDHGSHRGASVFVRDMVIMWDYRNTHTHIWLRLKM